jgi:UDP-2,3-diacylglucosamine hydrolase
MIYFASDFHLGMPEGEISFQRELKVCAWLDKISEDASEVFLLGDTFDFWFEYKKVVPRGYVRFLGKLAQMTDSGIRVHVCVGNHDLWMQNYLEKECGVRIFREPEIVQFGETRFYIHHGDGLGPGDEKYKFLKKIFTNTLANYLFGQLHPDFAFRIASGFSKKSRLNQPKSEEHFLGNDREFLVQHCEQVLAQYKKNKIKEESVPDYFIFGHRHLKLDIELSNGHSRYINLGEWFHGSAYVRFDGEKLEFLDFDEIKKASPEEEAFDMD